MVGEAGEGGHGCLRYSLCYVLLACGIGPVLTRPPCPACLLACCHTCCCLLLPCLLLVTRVVTPVAALPACCVPGGPVAVLGGAFIAGFFASACSLPFDFVKTRMQKMTPNPDGTMPYKSAMDCAMQTLKQEGFLKFYTGFGSYITR